jgi:hypothetical protein
VSIGVIVASGLMWLIPGSAGANTAVPYSPDLGDLVVIIDASGESALVSGDGFAADSTVLLTVRRNDTGEIAEEADLGSDGAGAMEAVVEFEPLDPGPHTASATGPAPDGATIQLSGAIVVLDATTVSDEPPASPVSEDGAASGDEPAAGPDEQPGESSIDPTEPATQDNGAADSSSGPVAPTEPATQDNGAGDSAEAAEVPPEDPTAAETTIDSASSDGQVEESTSGAESAGQPSSSEPATGATGATTNGSFDPSPPGDAASDPASVDGATAAIAAAPDGGTSSGAWVAALLAAAFAAITGTLLLRRRNRSSLDVHHTSTQP